MKQIFVFLLLAGVSFPGHADWRERRAALIEMHRVEEFRIFYSRSGTDALPSLTDSDRNGVPDYVDRLARDLTAARDRYDREVNLRHPLRSPRYTHQAEFIDVNVLKFPLNENGPRNGVAYDEVSSFARPVDSGRKAKVLVIDISNDLTADNRTPAHELFHLYQNGYTFFKNRWYTEGTARWAEDLGRKDRGRNGNLPRSSSEIRDMFRQTYETASFWKSVASRMDPAGGGQLFIKAFLEELDRIDDATSTQDHRASDTWKEADQFSSANNIRIWEALRNTLARPEFSRRIDEDVENLMNVRL